MTIQSDQATVSTWLVSLGWLSHVLFSLIPLSRMNTNLGWWTPLILPCPSMAPGCLHIGCAMLSISGWIWGPIPWQCIITSHQPSQDSRKDLTETLQPRRLKRSAVKLESVGWYTAAVDQEKQQFAVSNSGITMVMANQTTYFTMVWNSSANQHPGTSKHKAYIVFRNDVNLRDRDHNTSPLGDQYPERLRIAFPMSMDYQPYD